jgi:hypothetical protein
VGIMWGWESCGEARYGDYGPIDLPTVFLEVGGFRSSWCTLSHLTFRSMEERYSPLPEQQKQEEQVDVVKGGCRKGRMFPFGSRECYI